MISDSNGAPDAPLDPGDPLPSDSEPLDEHGYAGLGDLLDRTDAIAASFIPPPPLDIPADPPEPTVDAPTTAAFLSALEINRRVLTLRNKHEAAADKAKKARKALDAAQEELNDFLAGCDMPLFDRPAETKPAVDPDAWRHAPLEKFPGMKPAWLEAIQTVAAGLVLGELVDWQAQGHDLDELPGVGEATATKIADTIAVWWKEHPEFCPPPVPMEDECPDGEE